MRFASFRANSAHSSRVMPATGISGSTSVAPIRGCAPWCRRMSMSSPAFFTALKAASTTASGGPTKVTTVRLVASPGSTSSSFTPFVCFTTSVIWLITFMLRPSLKLGTHSTNCFSLFMSTGCLEVSCTCLIRAWLSIFSQIYEICSIQSGLFNKIIQEK